MSGLQTYEGVVLWVSPESCVVEEERRAHHISETTWTTTGELGPLHGNHASSQCAIACELLVACTYKIISIYDCTAKVTYTAQRIAHTQRMHTETPHIWPISAPPRHRPHLPSHIPRTKRPVCTSVSSTAGAVFGSCQSRSKHGQTPGASYAPNR
jgi:hypothetical protein